MQDNGEFADLPPDLVAAFRHTTTATLTTVLLKRGVRNVWMRGPRPSAMGWSAMGPGATGPGATGPGTGVPARIVGSAFTLRFVPAREDLATPESWASPTSTRAAIEAMPANAVVVADAGGNTGAGIFGDILCQRMVRRGVAGLVTDGAMRDMAGVAATGLPLWCVGAAAPASIAALTFVGWQQPVGCGGVAVMPNDVIVADGDGAVVVPRALAESVAEAALAQERLEDWIMREVAGGAALPGLYPPDAATLARYRAETGDA